MGMHTEIQRTPAQLDSVSGAVYDKQLLPEAVECGEFTSYLAYGIHQPVGHRPVCRTDIRIEETQTVGCGEKRTEDGHRGFVTDQQPLKRPERATVGCQLAPD